MGFAGQRTDGRRASESRCLKQEAQREAIDVEKEWALTDEDFSKKGGEHHVDLGVQSGRVDKWTGIDLQEEENPDKSRPYRHGSASKVALDASFPNGGFVIPAEYKDNTPVGYLSRIAWQNYLFDDDMRIESITEDGRFHISQPILRPGSFSKDSPNYLSEEAIENWLFDNGWEIDYKESSVAHAVYYHPETGVYAADAHAGNFGWDVDGKLKAFDLVLTPGKQLFPPSVPFQTDHSNKNT